jgi:hypothetical protein
MTHHPINPNTPPSQRERQHLAGLTGKLAALKGNPQAWQLNEVMAQAFADQCHAIAAEGPYAAQQPSWAQTTEDDRDVLRLGALAMTEAARRVKAQRQATQPSTGD